MSKRHEKPIAELTAADLKTKLGLSAGYVSDLLSRKRKPSLSVAVQIEAVFGVPPRAWLATDEG